MPDPLPASLLSLLPPKHGKKARIYGRPIWFRISPACSCQRIISLVRVRAIYKEFSASASCVEPLRARARFFASRTPNAVSGSSGGDRCRAAARIEGDRSTIYSTFANNVSAPFDPSLRARRLFSWLSCARLSDRARLRANISFSLRSDSGLSRMCNEKKKYIYVYMHACTLHMLDDIIPRRGTKVARFYDQMEARSTRL